MADAISGAGWRGAGLLDAERFHGLRPFAAVFDRAAFPDREDLNAVAARLDLRNARGMPLRFAAPDSRLSYEHRVQTAGEVPTRAENWHDLFNALAWFAFPRSKGLFNHLHAFELAAQPDSRRSAARDVLSLFDESGMVVASADPDLAALLRAFRWKELFWERREEVRASLHFEVFGHALHEQMLDPYEGITAKAVIVEVDAAFFRYGAAERQAFLDAALERHFANAGNRADTRSLHPVPVLGIPGWWPAADTASYYDNTAYFRPGRRSVAPPKPKP